MAELAPLAVSQCRRELCVLGSARHGEAATTVHRGARPTKSRRRWARVRSREWPGRCSWHSRRSRCRCRCYTRSGCHGRCYTRGRCWSRSRCRCRCRRWRQTGCGRRRYRRRRRRYWRCCRTRSRSTGRALHFKRANVDPTVNHSCKTGPALIERRQRSEVRVACVNSGTAGQQRVR